MDTYRHHNITGKTTKAPDLEPHQARRYGSII